MNTDLAVILASIGLVVGNAFFVMAEYALVGARRNKLEAAAKRGDRRAGRVLRAIHALPKYVAAMQVAITALGIGVGAVTEPFVTGKLEPLLGEAVPGAVRILISVVLVTLLLTVVGEVVPKYLTLKKPETVAHLVIRPLELAVSLLSPLAWVVQRLAALILRPLGVAMHETEEEAVPKEELLLMIRAGGAEGLEKGHADLVSRTLKLDALSADDIMVHRLDMKWLDASLDRDALLRRVAEIPHSRFPVCRGDIDDLVGVVYLHDIVKQLAEDTFSLEAILRPVIAVPENLSLDRIVTTMRDQKTQILIVLDEYGGTSGLITLEDVVEEVFGELEDRLESERPPIEVLSGGRISARAEVRIDELVDRLELSLEIGDDTQTLATMLVEALERMPKLGDKAETILGTMRVENMARRRITRVSIHLRDDLKSE